MTGTTIFDLQLHDALEIKKGCEVLRVPGGWIYSFGVSGPHWTSVFVPVAPSDEAPF